MSSPDSKLPPQAENPSTPDDTAIQDVSAWVLRIGVVTSSAVMLIGMVISYVRRMPTVKEMETFQFDVNFETLMRGIMDGRGRSIMELGILLLVLTPIIRVATSMLLFWFAEKDRFYAVVTLVVLLLTLLSLLVLG